MRSVRSSPPTLLPEIRRNRFPHLRVDGPIGPPLPQFAARVVTQWSQAANAERDPYGAPPRAVRVSSFELRVRASPRSATTFLDWRKRTAVGCSLPTWASTPQSGNAARSASPASVTATKRRPRSTKFVTEVDTGQVAHDAKQAVESTSGHGWKGSATAASDLPRMRAYTQHVDSYLVPHLGRLRLGDLHAQHVEKMLRDIAKPPIQSLGR